MSKRIFFATDIHGSEKCFRKFLNAGKAYNANVLILGGDLSGKILVPLVDVGGSFEGFFLGAKHLIKRNELQDTEKKLRDFGMYPVRVSQREYEELNDNKEKRLELFKELINARLREWLELAATRLKGTGISLYITGGNDDFPEIENILNSSSYAIGAEGRVLDIGGGYSMLSSGYSNQTPWNCPRDISDEELGKKIEEMANTVADFSRCIFNLHVPPYGTPLDKAPLLDKDLKPAMNPTGGYVMTSVGSKAVRMAIESYQPILALHGHIHESRAYVKLGRTLCLNWVLN
jgi:Icc-related predicted phosphoesterase